MSKIVKGIKKAVSGIVRGVKKVFKKITSSTIGKVLLAAAVIYLGGAALGHWAIPGKSAFATSINGSLSNVPFLGAGADAAGAAVNTAATTGGTGAATPVSLGGDMAAGVVTPQPVAAPFSVPTAGTGAGGGVSAVETGSAISGGQTVAGATDAQKAASIVSPPGGSYPPVPDATSFANTGTMTGVGAPKPKPSLLKRMMEGTGSFMREHPYVTMVGMQSAAAMASPDEVDTLKYAYDRDDEERERREKNWDVSGINLGFRPSGRPLSDMSGNPVYNANNGLSRGGLLRGNT